MWKANTDGFCSAWCADIDVAVLAEGGDVGVAGVGHAEAAVHAQRRGLHGGKARGGQQLGAGCEAVMGESVPTGACHVNICYVLKRTGSLRSTHD